VGRTTSTYAPYEPDFLKHAVAAIEDVMAEIGGDLQFARIDQPELDPAPHALKEEHRHPRSISEEKRSVGRHLILTVMAMPPLYGRAACQVER
jgi:hypothetical protein